MKYNDQLPIEVIKKIPKKNIKHRKKVPNIYFSLSEIIVIRNYCY